MATDERSGHCQVKKQQWSSSSKPKYCCWVLNYRCMFKCSMCYIWQTSEFDVETTLEEKKNFVSSLDGFVDSDFEFHLSGGEPLLTEGIFELIEHIDRRGYKSNMVTNGWLVTGDTLNRLVDSPLQSLTFSLDGFNAETHDSLRGMPGSYQRIMDAVAKIKDMKRTLSLSFILLITEKNIDEILPLVDWVQQHSEIEMISFQAVTQPFSQTRDDLWYKKKGNKLLWPQDIRKTRSVLDQLFERKRSGAKIGNHENHFRAFKKYFENPNKFLKKLKCNLGDYEFHVDPYGKVFFCCFTNPIGNIKQDSIPDIWNASATTDVRDSVYRCKQNCHIMINCFFEDEVVPEGWLDRVIKMCKVGS